MGNASKALIIAGAILLAILIISLGILIYNQASSVVTSNSMSEVDITTFNNKFTQYAGKQRGSTVRALIQQIQSSNAADENTSRQVTLSYGDTGASSVTGIDTGAMYDVTVAYSSSGSNNGLINSVTINKAK